MTQDRFFFDEEDEDEDDHVYQSSSQPRTRRTRDPVTQTRDDRDDVVSLSDYMGDLDVSESRSRRSRPLQQHPRSQPRHQHYQPPPQQHRSPPRHQHHQPPPQHQRPPPPQQQRPPPPQRQRSPPPQRQRSPPPQQQQQHQQTQPRHQQHQQHQQTQPRRQTYSHPPTLKPPSHTFPRPPPQAHTRNVSSSWDMRGHTNHHDEIDYYEALAKEVDRYRCVETMSHGGRCPVITNDEDSLQDDGVFYCEHHDPSQRCQGISTTRGNARCKIKSPTKLQPGETYYCYQHDPANDRFQCEGTKKDEGRRCRMKCRPSEVYNGVRLCQYHRPDRHLS
ncbi:MAG: hypothetical protein J3Q66DRAFT_46845 [Benniella sp.]|nr:MAG: hypothetical protein J3Q66DRAFT_46845 [Benniella sp.]